MWGGLLPISKGKTLLSEGNTITLEKVIEGKDLSQNCLFKDKDKECFNLVQEAESNEAEVFVVKY